MTVAAPRVWVLLGRHGGDNAQLLALAAGLGWPFEARRVAFNRVSGMPGLLLGPTRLGLARDGSDALAPPWPDLVLFAGFRCVSVARWIRRQSGGRSKLVAVGRPRAPLHLFDLVISTAQYELAPAANLLRNTLTLNRPEPERLRQAAEAWRERLGALPRPRTALLVGGDTRRRSVGAAWGEALAAAVNTHRRKTGGSIMATTSPRTPAAVTDALDARLAAPRHFFRWQPNADNPYSAYLALADAFIVTGDSASMLSEACWSGRPVFVFAPADDAPQAARAASPLPAWLVRAGLLTPERNMAAFRAALVAAGLAQPLGAATAPDRPRPPDFDHAVARVRALFADRPRAE